jgi:predicted NAD-dependent protein-ADP-ribosyltransferase YbiA (DUF1768 family)
MVQSKLAKGLNYNEGKTVSPIDKGHEATLYIIPILDDDYSIALGKAHDEYVKRHDVLYYPIYLLNQKNSGIEDRIGVFEIRSQDVFHIHDKDNDVNLRKLHGPLFFSFVNAAYLSQHNKGESLSATTLHSDDDADADNNDDDADAETIVKESNQEDEAYDEEQQAQYEQDDDDYGLYNIEGDITVDRTSSPSNDNPTQSDIVIHTRDTIFTKSSPLPHIEPLITETRGDAETICKSYKPKKSNYWLRKIMKNSHYKPVTVDGDGNCFFYCVVKAFESIGFNTTVDILREYLSQNLDQSHYTSYKTIYDTLRNVQSDLLNSQDEMKDRMNTLKKENEKATTVESQQELIRDGKKIRSLYDKNKMEIDSNQELLNEFEFMEMVHNLTDLRNFVKTKDYWIDSISFPIVEKILNTKILVVKQSDSRTNIVQCTPTPSQLVNPDHYILVEYSQNNHYDLIAYREKTIFGFLELPYSLKKTIMDTCIPKEEANRLEADSIYKIEDFRDFYLELYKKTPEEQVQRLQQKYESQAVDYDAELFDNNMTLSYYINADKNSKAGKGSHDKFINNTSYSQFAALNDKKNSLWRRRLDDEWSGCTDKNKVKDCNGDELKANFLLEDSNGKNEWATVKHYLLAIQYEKENPVLYKNLSVGSNHVMSKSWTAVKDAMKKEKSLKFSEDFDNLENFRKKALQVKFKSNPDLRSILMTTYPAKLVHIVGKGDKSQLIPDITLMEVRKEFINDSTI